MDIERDISDQVLVALRRIVRAIDLHSRRLAQEYGLTGPQTALLRELMRCGEMHASQLARKLSLSHATVTDILNRLERRDLIKRTRSLSDRRRILITLTERAAALVKTSPPLLQAQFSEQLSKLQEGELAQILDVLQRVALMMDAGQVGAEPALPAGRVCADPERLMPGTRQRLPGNALAPADPVGDLQFQGAKPGTE